MPIPLFYFSDKDNSRFGILFVLILLFRLKYPRAVDQHHERADVVEDSAEEGGDQLYLDALFGIKNNKAYYALVLSETKIDTLGGNAQMLGCVIAYRVNPQYERRSQAYP